MMLGGEVSVQCELVFEDEAACFSGATVTVRLEDVSRADAPARLVAEEMLLGVSHQPGSRAGPIVELRAPTVDDRASYAVRAHVDVDQDGQVSLGDYVSVENYPVLTFGYPDRVTVRLREIS